jgi:hypothetical protein
MLLRLHRKIFMLRRPRALARNAYCLTLTPGKKMPTVSLRVERRRGVAVGLLLLLLAAVSAMLAWGGE